MRTRESPLGPVKGELPLLQLLPTVIREPCSGSWWRFSDNSVSERVISKKRLLRWLLIRFVTTEEMRSEFFGLFSSFQASLKRLVFYSLVRLPPRSVAGKLSQPFGSAMQPLIDSIFFALT